jgi:hypothetical protein
VRMVVCAAVSAVVCGSFLCSVWQCARQSVWLFGSAAVCGGVRQCVAVCGSAAVCDSSAYGSVYTVRAIVYGNTLVRLVVFGSVSGSVRQCAAVCGSARHCGSVRQCGNVR